jgi:hypothetical protein
MKKMLLVIIATGSMVFANAQIQFGVKAGYNLASLTQSGSNQTSGLSSKSDFHAGILASLPLLKSVNIQGEALYSGQGASFSEGNATAKINYSYLNVPVLLKYHHESGLFAETGPQFGFLLSAKASADGQMEDLKSSTQSFDFSWALGVGYQIPVINLGIDARYNLGFTNIAKNSTDGTIKNSVFQLGVFYMIGGL